MPTLLVCELLQRSWSKQFIHGSPLIQGTPFLPGMSLAYENLSSTAFRGSPVVIQPLFLLAYSQFLPDGKTMSILTSPDDYLMSTEAQNVVGRRDP